MDAKTIAEKGKALLKAQQANESPSVIISMLNELKKGVVANEEILRSTKIGVTVSKSKQHKSPDVARLASDIVRKWRDELEKQRGSSNGKKGASPNRTASPATTQNNKPKSQVPTVAPDQRTWKLDKVDVNRTGEATRDRCIGLIYDGLAYLSEETSSTVLRVATAVEAAAYTKLGPEEREPYKTKMRSLYQNLKNKSNPQLRIRVVSGEISPEKFVLMTHDELKSEERKKEEQELKNENMRLARAPVVEKAISTTLTCGKCKKSKVSYSQAQTRSADEPMTTFCECMHCGNRWKVCNLRPQVFLYTHLDFSSLKIYAILQLTGRLTGVLEGATCGFLQRGRIEGLERN